MKYVCVCSRRHRRRGITFVEVLIVIGVIGLLAALMIPAVQRARESARRLQCANHLHQLAEASHAHSASHRTFPFTSVTSGEGGGGATRLHRAVSPHQDLIPFVDPAIAENLDRNDATAPFLQDGPPWSESAANRELLKMSVPVFLCPSDTRPTGGNNYRANLGISVVLSRSKFLIYPEKTAQMGAFVNGRAVRPDDFTDGLSNTALFSEKVVGDGNPSRYAPWRDQYSPSPVINTTQDAMTICRDYAIANPAVHYSFAGYTWLFGGWAHTWYNHISPPNSVVPDCNTGGESFAIGGGKGLYSARSFHSGGVNVAMGDGAVQFVSSQVDLRVWRAIGTRNGAEVSD